MEKLQVTGNVPLPRFGHTITYYSPGKVALFAGATGDIGQLAITDSLYTFDILQRHWRKIESTGTTPSPRAAHAAISIQKDQILVYGGATGAGGLASDDLYQLDLKDNNVGIWNTVSLSGGKTPGRRYGHTLTYTKPYLIVFGGNIGQREVNDCWLLEVDRKNARWTQLICQGQVPSPRVYHSAALCSSGRSSGMIVVFGGRNHKKETLNDSWGLRKHRDNTWDWVRAPENSEPAGRYQHTSHFVGQVMLVVGGRTNTSQSLPVQLYDTSTSEWRSFNHMERYRHGSWIANNNLFIHGGFDLSLPSTPTDAVSRISLQTITSQATTIMPYSLQNSTSSSTQSSNRVSPNSTPIMNKFREKQNSTGGSHLMGGLTNPQTPNMSSQDFRKKRSTTNNTSIFPSGNNNNQNVLLQQQQQHMVSSTANTKVQSRFKLLEPVLGRAEDKFSRGALEVRRNNLTSKQDIPAYFLNNLLIPDNHRNADGIKFIFKPQHIIALCDIVQEILRNQPMVLRVKAPLKIFGDIHGQYSDLMSFFALYGSPHKNGKSNDIEQYDYIFLGDFVDRGNHSLETICLLMALKATYPDKVHLIRGNHEDIQINSSFGFIQQCEIKCQEDSNEPDSVFKRINYLFTWLPLAAVVEDKILCLHGGIGSKLETIQDINSIKRPLEVEHVVTTLEQQLALDILWSDPTDTDADMGIQENFLRDPQRTGNIVKFGPDVVQRFLKRNDLSMIIRAHECVMDGFQRFAGGSLITLFSATDYCRRHKNAGAILTVKKNLQIIPKLIYPSNSDANNWIEDEEQLKQRPPTPPRWKDRHHN